MILHIIVGAENDGNEIMIDSKQNLSHKCDKLKKMLITNSNDVSKLITHHNIIDLFLIAKDILNYDNMNYLWDGNT